MPNIIPPIVSSSPPPLDPIDDDNDEDDNEDDFGDFTVADFGTHSDSAMQKSISDPSWALPNVKECLSKSDICKNGVISLALSTEDALPQSHTEVLNNDELLENADYASHDSVVSAVTDSGNCSASQTSNGTSPMPNAELEDEAVAKPENCHFRNATPDLSTGSGELNCTVPSNAPKFSNFNEDLIDGDRTLNISSETLVDDSSQLSADILTSPINNLSDELSSTEHSDGQEKVSKSEAAIAVNNVEGQQSGPSSFPSTVATDNDDGDPDEFGVWSSSTVPLELNSALATIASQSNLDSEPMSDCAVFTSPLESQVSKSLDGLEDNDCVRGMIIPDIPGLGDIDDCDDDEFGEFRGTECPDKCSSGAQSIDEPDYDIHFQSPSRRPTLVLSDNVANVTDTQTVHTVEESQDPMDVSSNEPNINSLEENTSVMCNSTEEEICVTNFPSNLSSQDPTFTGDFTDEFADFSQAEVEENPASNVWAQAAHTASSIQTSLPSQDPLEFDDFDDYESAEFQSADQKTNPEPPSNSQFDLDTIRSTLGEVLKENFPVPDGNYRSTELENMGTSGLSGLVLDVEESDIWQGLRDLEATPSLSFQWPGSHSNRGLLGALNIDSRNILFGPKWNTVVPRFAANLGFSPLEPVRAVQNQPPSDPSPRPEVIQPQIVDSIKPSTSEKGEVVPAAQFDWNDSGLTNPLDSNNGALATTAASGNPAMTTTPLQVEQLLASSKRSAPLSSLEKKSRDPTLSPEAVRVLDTLPELAFLSARMLMFPVQGDRNENKL